VNGHGLAVLVAEAVECDVQREEVSPHVRHALLNKTRENVDLGEATGGETRNGEV
jgi:hypothetical protein